MRVIVPHTSWLAWLGFIPGLPQENNSSKVWAKDTQSPETRVKSGLLCCSHSSTVPCKALCINREGWRHSLVDMEADAREFDNSTVPPSPVYRFSQRATAAEAAEVCLTTVAV